MILRRGCLFLAILAGTLAVGLSAQEGRLGQGLPKAALEGKAERAEKKADNLVVNVELVNVLFTATDRKGRLVTDLEKSDLRLYEDNKPQAITNFSRETDLPLTI